MTVIPVNDIGTNIPYVAGTSGTGTNSGTDFMGTLKEAIESRAGDSNSDLPVSTTAEKPRADIDRNEKNVASRNDDRTKSDDRVGDKTAKESTKVSDDTAGKVRESAEEIKEEVAASMDVTTEDVETAMANLGLSMIDLLNPDNMTELVVELSGGEDAVSILTDENLYSTLDNLKGFAEDVANNLMNELDLSQEAFGEVLLQTEALTEQISITDADLKPEMVTTDETPLEGMKDFKVTTTINGEQVTMDVTVDDTTGSQVATYQTMGGDNEKSSDGDAQKENDENDSSGRESLYTQTLQTNNEYQPSDVSDVFADQIEHGPSPAEIAEQIMDNMKANLKPEMTELEMSLHPASLGNVRVNLSAHEGQITAQFIAQDETVKNAIETQMIQLTKQFEEQGIRVEHVEVSVADYRFSQNENQSGQEHGSEQQAGKPKTGRIRRIDMSAFDSDTDLDELEDSDRIAAEMMAHDGNTVDYTV